MFRALICPSSGLFNYIVELPYWPFRSWFAVCWEFGCGSAGVVSWLLAEAEVIRLVVRLACFFYLCIHRSATAPLRGK